ncbi:MULTISPECIES: bifunctional 5,6,7,8-tetrahydromethanopterin hydro-lyase/3-hexulose-6-phosphate synthase [Methanobacterium]|mgnify:FL=1|jgi:bifunctional enzyme Fae/Hps|uniref:Bifunctional enzyme Fae/Hps n=1 Tax=Methanobacterium formicicum TaxID=2162 RepID=A0A090I8W8_METFO|nr:MULTISPECIES: bifunctional 5,6,7,8-tetrahydromethanopterin hydro-lyase/3-hexulose-6-phosphate synthase [Methanobacterium]AIS30893.1 bifunctional formaldehyde-activating enzyme/3- hexulose-6-phosphate synthase Fae/Hps [Methanobacterium formicicum]MBF4474935.1 bifunctional 5,6,7,8-tetrahydromethanopterin hydro-lyase/3-hexulose-6-phosphate synthase [Methanobacterium formicicum]MDG3547005.1 bifunctional 5,6,7,8-tetrahydromethanopterin hydro-lyase/3-hexulose-6-phosphate synthase [Methanobacterium 
MYQIGEALIGNGNELAHIDLVIGDKNGPVGTAFVNNMSNLSLGHTPLLSVIRPNLMTKPATLIVPKVSVRDLDDANKIFGPAQTAVGRAVADAVEEGILPAEEAENMVLIVSVFIHPEASDFRKIYQYNYGATKLALRRAMEGYPSVNKVLAEKDRGAHPVMGFKVNRLWSPPYLQVALDLDNMQDMERIIDSLPDRERILIEAGTPLVKKFGVGIVSKIRELKKDAFIIADLKTLDVGRIEVKMAADETADAVAISGLGTQESIEKAIHEAQKQGIYSILDMMNVDNFTEKLENLNFKPDIVLLHRNVDLETLKAERGEEQADMTEWGNINQIKEIIGKNGRVAVAGGIVPKKMDQALDSGADVIVVGRYIIGSRDVRRAAEDFLEKMPQDPDTMRLALDEDESI